MPRRIFFLVLGSDYNNFYLKSLYFSGVYSKLEETPDIIL